MVISDVQFAPPPARTPASLPFPSSTPWNAPSETNRLPSRGGRAPAGVAIQKGAGNVPSPVCYGRFGTTKT